MRKPLLAACLLFSWSFLAHPLVDRAAAQDFSGVWRGQWTANATSRRPEHGGPLRVRLTRTGANTYQGRFSGRFAIVIPYFYRATVYQRGGQLVSSRKLGRSGQYTMSLNSHYNSLSGAWTTGEQSGSVRLRRRR